MRALVIGLAALTVGCACLLAAGVAPLLVAGAWLLGSLGVTAAALRSGGDAQ